MTMTALQKGCDQDDLAVNTTNTFRGDAIPRQPVHPIASLEPQLGSAPAGPWTATEAGPAWSGAGPPNPWSRDVSPTWELSC
jgi:hypothetical protein